MLTGNHNPPKGCAHDEELHPSHGLAESRTVHPPRTVHGTRPRMGYAEQSLRTNQAACDHDTLFTESPHSKSVEAQANMNNSKMQEPNSSHSFQLC